MGKLTATKCKAITKPGLHGDGGGLYLRVAAGGSRQWVHRLTIDGKRRDLGLGGFPAVTLAKARTMADANRAAVAEGRDPLAERQRATVPTFETAARTLHEINLGRWRPGKHTTQWLSALERHAFPLIGGMPVDRIGREDVLRVLTPIWASKPELARRVRQRIRNTLSWAQAHGFVEHNYAGEIIDGALPAMPAIKAHMRAIPYRDVADTMKRIDATKAGMATKACFRFLILTAARSGEARGATWAEIDLEAATWTVPGERMKQGKAHRVPLSDAALAVLRDVRPLSGGDGLVFPGVRGGMLSENTLSKLCREYGIAGTPHGMRSAFRDWCAETGKPRELAEAALSHTVGGVEGAYFRSDLIEQRRGLMQAWAAYLDGDTGNVIPMIRKR